MPYITTKSGINWYYQVKGRGEVLFFVHGWSSERSIWQLQSEYFSKTFKTITVDLPGHGKTSFKKINFDTLIRDLRDIILSFKIRVNLVGASFGGLISIALAAKFSNLIKRLILVDTAAKFINTPTSKGVLDKKKVYELIEQLKKDYLRSLSLFYQNLFTDYERQNPNFKIIWEKLTKRITFPKQEALIWFLLMMKNIDLRKELPKIRIPTLIIAGKRDPLFKKPAQIFLNTNLKGSKLVFLENLGHIPFLTDPEGFNRALQRFLVNG